MKISNERLATFFLNWWERSEKDFTLSDMEDICKDIGMTRNEFIELVSRSDEFIDKDGWTPEPEANEKVSVEDVSVGDSDQAILETALKQIGVNYEYYGGHTDVNFIELKDNNNYSLGIEFYFDTNGNYTEILC